MAVTRMADDDAKPMEAKPWLDAIQNAEKVFHQYSKSCDKIDKLFADLERLASNTGDREFQIFWANMEIMRPSVYQRPPQPVVMPRHNDTGEVVRKASELLERVLEYDVEADGLHETLLLVRNDLCLVGRGVPWVLDNGECIHVDRGDFLHEPARKWKEVTWVARAVYLTRDEGVEKFGPEFRKVERQKPGKDRADNYGGVEEKAKVWEIWDKRSSDVIWVAHGLDEVLDRVPAFVDVKGFFPCPKPAYATLEPRTLKPVPDFAYYRDQANEINELTARISALTASLRVKGFYAAGTSEVGEAIETAMKQTDNRAILVPISNFAALGGTALKDSIVWLPVAEIAKVLQSCIEVRRQLIEDVYEITGLSDIMRGVTEAQETLGAQNLKAQYGSVRVQQKQAEMVRVALDVLRIKAEIYAEEFSIKELLTMSGMQLPTLDQVKKQHVQAQMQAESQGQPTPPPPDVVTVEQVAQLLTSERTRPFAMEVETDSTIAPNEQAEKAIRVEFIEAIGTFMGQAAPMIEAQPETAPFLGELLKFGMGAFRAGRDMGGAVDDFVDQMKAKAEQAAQGQEPSPEAMKAQAEAQKTQMESQLRQAEMQQKAQKDQADMQMRQQEFQAKMAGDQQDRELKAVEIRLRSQIDAQKLAIQMGELGIKQDDQALKERQAEIDTLLHAVEIEMEKDQQRAVKIGDGQ